MTSPSSFTFSSSPGTYLRWLLAAIFIGVALACSVSWLGEKFNLIDHRFYVNYHFQLSKLNDSASIDTLFVGDSSLGALLDVDAWSQLRGKPGQHLALTGSYGYAGSLNMLRHRLVGGRPRNVVIFHAVDMMTRQPAFLGYLQTLPEAAEIRDVPLLARIVDQFEFYFSRDIFVGTLRGVWHKLNGRTNNYLGKDYIRIKNVVGAPDQIGSGEHVVFSPAEIDPQKTLFLKHLAALCRAEHVNCIYAHGPIYEQICETSQAYLQDVSALIESAGLDVLPGTPVCVPRGELADTIDHVRQDLKTRYTRRYHDLLRPYLQ